MQVNKNLWQHQRDGLNHILRLDGSWIMADMGTGKTLMSLAAVTEVGSKLTLIVTTRKSAINVWPLQIQEHVDGAYTIIAPSGTVNERAATIHEQLVATKNRTHQFVVVNYDAAVRGNLKTLLGTLRPDIIIADESHRIKSHSAKATNLLHKLGLRADKRIAMTGTPLPNGNMDAFGQMLFVEPSVFGTRFVPFRSRYAITVPISRDNPYAVKIVGYKNVEEFDYKIKPYAFRVSKDDVLDLPPYHHIVRYVYLQGKAASAYRDMKKSMVADTDAGRLTAANVLVRILRLQEITSGHYGLHTEKLDVLSDIVDGFLPDEPFVVFAKFTEDINAITHQLTAAGMKVSRVTGQYDDYLSWYHSKTQALVVQIDAGAESLDFTRANYGIYYSATYNMGTYEQSLARLHRPGQRRPVHYYHIVAQGTIDEIIYAALDKKSDMQQAVFDYIQGRA